MKIKVYATDKSGDETNEENRLLWYPNLIKALHTYISMFNNLPQIGIEFLEDDGLDPMTIKGIVINPISEEITVHFEYY
jgi:hypothetical protein